MSEDRRQYLPPGSMRKERRSGVIEGVLIAAVVFLVALMMLAILLLAILRPQASGCCAQSCCAQSCCTQTCPTGAKQRITNQLGLTQPQCCVTPDAAPRRQGVVTPDRRGDTRSIPEPGTLALIGAGIIGWRLIA